MGYAAITVELIGDKFSKPVYVTSYPDDPSILFVVEQAGRIMVLRDGEKLKTPFIDIRDRVQYPAMPGDERGLLGFAFDPNFNKNGFFYVNYVNEDNMTVISRFSAGMDENGIPESEEILIKLEQPFSNHNGGMVAFGPKDGYLYIALGDGGKFGDPFGHAQNIETMLGSILRIDVRQKRGYTIPTTNPFARHAKAKREIWLYGLRNPWRFSFDKKTGDMYIADVGQNTWEEINYLPASNNGGDNFGWNAFEGNHIYNDTLHLNHTLLPVLEYPNDANYIRVLAGWDEDEVEGCSVTGGYVYRGEDIPEIQGLYFFSDYCTGKIWSITVIDGKAQHLKNWTDILNVGGDETVYISSFGEDSNGELYIVDINGGIYKIVKNGK